MQLLLGTLLACNVTEQGSRTLYSRQHSQRKASANGAQAEKKYSHG